jgi:hypothetical protein
MTLYEDKFCRIAFEDSCLIAESKASSYTMESNLVGFFTRNNTFTLDGMEYRVRIDNNDMGSERYFRFCCKEDNKYDWLLIVRCGYILKVENIGELLDRNIWNAVNAIGDNKYLILIEDTDKLDFLLDDGFWWNDFERVDEDCYGYARQYASYDDFEVWITYAEYGRIKCGLPVVVEALRSK